MRYLRHITDALERDYGGVALMLAVIITPIILFILSILAIVLIFTGETP